MTVEGKGAIMAKRKAPIVTFLMICAAYLLVSTCTGCLWSWIWGSNFPDKDLEELPSAESGWIRTVDPELVEDLRSIGRTSVVLVGVDKHRSQHSWDSTYVSTTLKRLKRAMVDTGMVQRVEDVRVVTGREATREGVKFEIDSIQLNTQNDLFVFYFVGHGFWLEEEGRCFFTYDTKQSGAGFENVLHEADLRDWITKAVGDSGAHTLAVLDCCYTIQDKGVNSPLPRHSAPGRVSIGRNKLANIELLACGPNGCAYEIADKDISLFSFCLVEALNSLCSEGGDVGFRSVADRTIKEAHRALGEIIHPARRDVPEEDRPRIIGDADFPLRRGSGFSFVIEAKDKTNGVKIKGAEIRFDGNTYIDSNICKGVPKGDYRVELSAPGYFRFITTMTVSRATQGCTFSCELLPEFVLIEGIVRGKDGPISSIVKVSALCPSEDKRSIFLYNTETDDEGNFMLRIPTSVRCTAVKLYGLGTKREVDLPSICDKITVQGNAVCRYSLGIVDFKTRFDPPPGKIFCDVGQQLFQRGFDLQQNKRYEDAELAFRDARSYIVDTDEAREYMDSHIVEVMEDRANMMFINRKYSECIDYCLDALREFPENNVLREIGMKACKEHIPDKCRSAYRQAMESLEIGEWEEAEASYEEAWPLANHEYQKRIAEGLSKCYQELQLNYRSEASRHYDANELKKCWLAVTRVKKYGDPGRLLSKYEKYIVDQCPDLKYDPEISMLVDQIGKRIVFEKNPEAWPDDWIFNDNKPPELEWIQPLDGNGMAVYSKFELWGKVSDNYVLDRVEVNGLPVENLHGERSIKLFSSTVDLSRGENHLEVVVVDRAENRAVFHANVILHRIPKLPGFAYIKEEAYSCGSKSNMLKVYRHEKTGLDFVLLPGGVYQMGSPKGRGDTDEHPQHQVTVKPFLICRTECTKAAWLRGADDEDEIRGGDDVIQVGGISWDDVTDWCDDLDLRLPTEAEWEYACRARTITRFCCGDTESDLRDYANYNNDLSRHAQPVKQKKPNAFGLFDMHGNAWEWCQDDYHDDYNGAPNDGSAWVTGDDSSRVYRGGSVLSNAWGCRSADRDSRQNDGKSPILGFRPAKSIE